MTLSEILNTLKGKWLVVIETRRLGEAADIASTDGDELPTASEYTIRDNTVYKQDIGGEDRLPPEPYAAVFDTQLQAEASLGTIGRRYGTTGGNTCKCLGPAVNSDGASECR